jgi:two-component system chemotaxis response regulator CheY
MAKLVLIVEDSETCAETLQIALESLPGVQTRIVSGARAAIATLRTGEPEVAAIVTDLHMGNRDGLDLIRALRAEPRYARLPILLISGDSDPRLPERALSEGADAFFAKPYSPAAVRRKLEQLLC